MRRLIFLLVSIIAFDVSAQELKQVTIQNKFDGIREEISVLASDHKTKQGEYKLYKYDKLSVEGNYSNDLKDGIWKEYDFRGKNVIKEYNYKNGLLHGTYKEYFDKGDIKKSGSYLDGLKEGHWEVYDYKKNIFETGDYLKDKEVGVWEFYNNGILSQKYSFDNDMFILNNDTAVQYNVIVYDLNRVPMDTLDIGPVYIGGLKHLLTFIGNEVNYPRIARDNGIEGTVYTELTINVNGEITDAKIIRGIGGGCDEESVRVLMLTSGRWHPARDNEKAVESKTIVPIKYQMQ